MIPNYSPYGQNDVKSPYAWARPDCTTCKCPMEDMYSGPNSTTPTNEWWECARCHFKKPKFTVQPPKSSVTISFSQPTRDIAKSPVPIDETASFQKLKPHEKITKLLNLNSNRPQPKTIFCEVCKKERKTLGDKCPVCARHPPMGKDSDSK